MKNELVLFCKKVAERWPKFGKSVRLLTKIPSNLTYCTVI